jgi:hypothetical protein
MSKAQGVLFGGLALAGVNAWTSQQRTALGGVLNGQTSAEAPGHAALLQLGAELVLIVVAAVAADSSDGVGTGMAAAIAALWVLWAIKYYTRKPSAPAVAVPGSSVLA